MSPDGSMKPPPPEEKLLKLIRGKDSQTPTAASMGHIPAARATATAPVAPAMGRTRVRNVSWLRIVPIPSSRDCPLEYLGPQPEHRLSPRALNNRPRHIRISLLVNADSVPVGKPKQISNFPRIDQIFSVDLG